jgi:histidinol-phosphate aminotransferase
LNKIKYPYNLNVLSQQKLSEALIKVEEKNVFVKEINELKKKLADDLRQIPSLVKIFPSDSNMLLVKFKEAKKLFNYLLDQKVIVRDRSNVVLCEDCLRLSIGTEAENEILIKAIKSFI